MAEESEWKFLDLVKPFIPFIPKVRPPAKKPRFEVRCYWTVVVLFLFLICCQIPLYGIRNSSKQDPLYWVRMMLASNRGSLMELGVSPIITSGMVLQMLVGVKFIAVDFLKSEEDRELFEGLQKLLGLLLTLIQATIYVYWLQLYGELGNLGHGNAILLITQLFMAGVLTLLLDELLAQYGLGAGISLFIATNICENIVWRAFSPTTISINQREEPKFEGAVIAAFHLLVTKTDKMQALKEAFFRKELPNLTNLLATIVVILVVTYIQGFKIEIQLQKAGQRGGGSFPYPIKLFSSSNIPVIVQSALVSHLYLFSQLLHKRYSSNFLIRLIGEWSTVDGRSKPVGGLAYYVSPPESVSEIWRNPLHCMIYVAFMLGTCAFVSYIWLEFSNSNARDRSKALEAQGLVLKGHTKKSVLKVLSKYVPISAAFGGMCIGALSMFADAMGAIGSGTGILMAVSIIMQYIEAYNQETKNDSAIFMSHRGRPGLF